MSAKLIKPAAKRPNGAATAAWYWKAHTACGRSGVSDELESARR